MCPSLGQGRRGWTWEKAAGEVCLKVRGGGAWRKVRKAVGVPGGGPQEVDRCLNRH